MSAWGLFIAGTDTGVGKTRVTVALLRALQARGVRAAGMKPIASGTDARGRNADVQALRTASAACLARDRLADLNPYCFASPVSPHIAAARAHVRIDPARIHRAYRRLARDCEALLVEGTGGWLAPISARRTMADVWRALGLPVVLVVGVRLGCLNHAQLTARALRADGARLVGWIGSVIEPDMQALTQNLATLEQRLAAPPLGLLPFARQAHGDALQLQEAARTLQLRGRLAQDRGALGSASP